MPTPVLELRGIVKNFGANRALDHVDFVLQPRQIHALLGENGAGKSTLMNIVRGMMRATSGETRVMGSTVAIRTPRDAAALGIGMVHQHFLLVQVFTVTQNLTLATQTTGVLSDPKSVVSKATQICERLGWTIPFGVRIDDLPVGVQQRVEILKVLLGDARILLFDEPTAVLAPNEIEDFLNVLRKLRDDGRSIIFVSHKLREVIAVSDEITVLRRGRVTGVVKASETSAADLARRMVGAEETNLLAAEDPDTRAQYHAAALATDSPVARAVGLSTSRLSSDDVGLHDVSFEVGRSEVLGIAGVDGNGQTELFEVLAGVRPYSGQIEVADTESEPGNRSRGRQHNIALVPPDRQRQGLALSLSVAENLTLQAAFQAPFQRGSMLNLKRLDELSKQLRNDYDIRTTDLSLPASSLSGGNQQKIVIARALWQNPRFLVASSPTRGLDVSAAAFVHRKIDEARASGAAVILISTELDEIRLLSTRIAVLYEGRVVATVEPDTSLEQLGLLMGGHGLVSA